MKADLRLGCQDRVLERVEQAEARPTSPGCHGSRSLSEGAATPAGLEVTRLAAFALSSPVWPTSHLHLSHCTFYQDRRWCTRCREERFYPARLKRFSSL